MIAFGPVPSRRLGQSLGINNIPAKICTYSCVYCQLGRTIKMHWTREKYYGPDRVFKEVSEKVKNATKLGERIDYLTFVPDGEPTLDNDLEEEIKRLRNIGIKIAVITNSSLIYLEEVRSALRQADLVSVKVDSTDDQIWRKIDRPPKNMKLGMILEGIKKFAASFEGTLLSETMLVKGLNDGPEAVRGVAQFLAGINPDTAYISIPIRPPAENFVETPDEETIVSAYNIMSEHVRNVEYLIGYEGNAFAFTGNAEEDILSTTSVHPMRSDAVSELLRKAGADWSIVEKLIEEKKLIKLEYKGKTFYMRKLA